MWPCEFPLSPILPLPWEKGLALFLKWITDYYGDEVWYGAFSFHHFFGVLLANYFGGRNCTCRHAHVDFFLNP